MKKPRKTAAPPQDKTAEALIKMAERALEEHFADPKEQETYRKWRRHAEANRKRGEAVEPTIIGVWDMDAGGTLAIMPLPAQNQFAVLTEHPKFRAGVTGTYDLAGATFSDGTLMQLEGSKKVARETALAWTDESDDDVPADLLAQALMQAAGPDTDDSGDRPFADLPDEASEPPPLSATDIAGVDAAARALATQFRRHELPEFGSVSMTLLERNPRMLWPILDGLIATANAAERDDHLLQAYNFLVVQQLELLRYHHERGWAWATRMLTEFQERLIRIAADKMIPQGDWFDLAAALTRAKVPVNPDMKAALAETGMATVPSESVSFDVLRGLLDEMADGCQQPFDVIAAFSDLGAVVPAPVRTFVAHELALSKHQVLRDTTPLMLLDAEAEVRRAAAGVLEQTAGPDTMSAESLRRIIAVRNWLPEADREILDRVIRKARTKGVECAQWLPVADVNVLATSIDGSGAQSVLATSWSRKKGTVAGVLTKQGFGVRDTWCDTDQSRKEINGIQRTLMQETEATEVDRSYMDVVVQHAIAVGLEAGNLPPPLLLDVAEHLHAVDWQARRLDIAAEALRLFEALGDEKRTPKAIAASLRRSGRWIKAGQTSESWFEGGPEARAVINGVAAADNDMAVHRIMTEILPGTRKTWAERFLLLALQAQASRAPARHAQWADLAILAHELCGDRPLPEIPVMVAVARQTVMVARAEAW